MRPLLALLLALLIAAPLAWFASVPPATRPSAQQQSDIAAFATRPHPIGSPADADAASYLLGRLGALGLETRVQRASVGEADEQASSFTGGRVANLIGVRPGRDRRLPALLLMAHYDSVPASPGAADDGAGVAAALEIAARIHAPVRDVVVLLTDGEEAGLLGARAFFGQDPLARRIGFVINMDTRGSAGRTIMHETGPDSAGAIALYAATTRDPTTDSIAAFVKRFIRNNTDFAIAKRAGLPGLNFSFIGSQFDYHAASSTPANLDPRTLAHLTEQAAGPALAVAASPTLPAAGPDPAYASLLGWRVLAYRPWVGWLILAAGAALGVAGLRGTRPRLGAAVALGVQFLAGAALAGGLVRALTRVPFGFTEVRPLLAWWPLYEAALALAAAAALLASLWAASAGRWRAAVAGPIAAGLLILLLIGWSPLVAGGTAVTMLAGWFASRTPADLATRAAAPFAALLPLAVIVQALAPQAAVLLGWATLASGLVLLLARRPRLGLCAAALPAALLLAQDAATAHLLTLTVGENLGGIVAPFALIAAALVAPMLAALPDLRWPALALASAALAATLTIALVDPSSPSHPRPEQLLTIVSPDGRRAWAATSLTYPGPWTMARLDESHRPVTAGRLYPAYAHALATPIAPNYVALPVVTAGEGSLTIASPTARETRVVLGADRPLDNLRINGIPARLRAGKWGYVGISWFGPGPLAISFATTGRVEARWSALSDGRPAGLAPLPPMPADAMPWYNHGATLVTGRATLHR